MVPDLPNQAWFLVLLKILIHTPFLTTSRKYLLKLPQYPELVHTMQSKIDIVVCHFDGLSQKATKFESMLNTYWKHRGDRQQGRDMLDMYSDSRNIVINGLLITFRQTPK